MKAGVRDTIFSILDSPTTGQGLSHCCPVGGE